MKKDFLRTGNARLRLAFGIFAISLFFAACNKDDTPGNSNTPVAGLMAFNLAPDKGPVGFTLSGNQLSNVQLGFNNYTGNYLPIYTGTRQVASFDYISGGAIASTTADFSDSMYYSVFLLGANGQYRNLVVKDTLDTLRMIPGKAWVRYINAIPDSSAVPDVTVAGMNEEYLDRNAAPFGTVSGFKTVTAGTVNTSISNGGNIFKERSISLQENGIYTVMFTGMPGATDTSMAVQVKFIQNGVVTK